MTFRKYFLLFPLIALGACAYTFDRSYQDVEIRTPGAHDALCVVEANGIKYKFYPPETRQIPKSEDDLIVDCTAPGNRHRMVVLEPKINNKFYGNAVTGMATGPWDYASGAMFEYPDVIEVSFVGMAVKPMGQPVYNNPDIKQPEEYYLEEFRATSPRMNEDRFRQQVPIQRRVAPGSADDLYDEGFRFESNSVQAPPSAPLINDSSDSGAYIDDMFGGEDMTDDNASASTSPAPLVQTGDDAVVVIDTIPDITTDPNAADTPATGMNDDSVSQDMPFPESMPSGDEVLVPVEE
ncbi:MAG: hypothetical protein ACLFR0_02930 [Alphaproteobacteria bacterium]